MSTYSDETEEEQCDTDAVESSESMSNRRQSPRINREDRMFARVVAVDSQHPVPFTARCNARDASAEGLGLIVPQPVEIGTPMEVWMHFEGRPGKLYLSGVVRWASEANDQGECRVGLELRPEPGTDFETWRELMEAASDVLPVLQALDAADSESN